MTDPLGGSQILPYLAELAGRGHSIDLISFEKPGIAEAQWADVSARCASAGIAWHPMAYHKHPPILSTVRDIVAMKRKAGALSAVKPYDIVHCRSYIAAVVGVAMKARFGTRFLFDMRGYWADEKVEGGSWPLGNPLFRAVYRHFKRLETDFLQNADATVSLTRTARDELMARSAGKRPLQRVEVIPCCVDFDHFAELDDEQRGAARRLLGIEPDALVLGYLGSLGGNYMLDEMLRFFAAVRDRRPGARFLFVTRNDPAEIRRAAAKLDIGAGELIIRSAQREEVPGLIGIADLGVAFKQPTFSAKACSPTKLGEMLALGIPMVVNAGVGDVEQVIADTGAGVMVDRFDRTALDAAADAVLALNLNPSDTRAGARRWFALEDGVAAYDAIYRSLNPAEAIDA
ncbi:MAG: glycosyltransferase [Pseudomonadota bacterium]|nr:glycosyltransferase [Pseudomonadota bacterium]